MKCEEVRDEMIAYLKGELDEARKNEIDEHLARCQGCRRELESAQKILHKTQAANKAGMIALTQEIIEKAIVSRASDIHCDPTVEGADVSYRIDGVLQPIRKLSKPERDAVIARIRQMAGLPLAETRTLQDGRFDIKVGGKEFDVRLAVVPVLLGERLVTRILDREVPLLGLDKMNFSDEQMEAVRQLVGQPNGVVVTTGPTGSGKTTLLYSMVMELIKPGVSVVTIEDPVEYLIPGVQQAQVDPAHEFTFATALRGFMRQDPDVIMVGEIRDFETMVVASEAALTGHLVLGQLVMQNAIDIPQNMVAFGVDPWITGRVLTGVIACRLVRKICQECKEEYSPSSEALEFLGLQDKAGGMKFHRGRGCEKCNMGHRGRVQLHEILVLSKELSRMICKGETDPDVLFRQAVQDGFKPMIEDARRFVLDGTTTPEEVYRVLGW